MSYYADYIKEREGFDIIEDGHGFAAYKITGEACYIRDIYVAMRGRDKGLATAYANKIGKIAKDAGCTCILGSVDPNANGATESLKVLLSYGFRLLGIENGLIYFKKDI